MVVVVIAIVVGVMVGCVALGSADHDRVGDAIPVDGVQVERGWIVRVPRVAGVYAWMEHGAVEVDGRYFISDREVIFADPAPGEEPVAAYRETSASGARAIRAQETARREALVRRAEYLREDPPPAHDLGCPEAPRATPLLGRQPSA